MVYLIDNKILEIGMTVEECIDKRIKVNVSCYNVCGIPFNVSGYLLEPRNYFGSQYYLHVGMPDKYLITPLLLKKLNNYWFNNTEERDVFVKSIYDEKGHCLYSDHYMDEDSIAYHMNKYSCYSELINKKSRIYDRVHPKSTEREMNYSQRSRWLYNHIGKVITINGEPTILIGAYPNELNKNEFYIITNNCRDEICNINRIGNLLRDFDVLGEYDKESKSILDAYGNVANNSVETDSYTKESLVLEGVNKPKEERPITSYTTDINNDTSDRITREEIEKPTRITSERETEHTSTISKKEEIKQSSNAKNEIVSYISSKRQTSTSKNPRIPEIKTTEDLIAFMDPERIRKEGEEAFRDANYKMAVGRVYDILSSFNSFSAGLPNTMDVRAKELADSPSSRFRWFEAAYKLTTVEGRYKNRWHGIYENHEGSRNLVHEPARITLQGKIIRGSDEWKAEMERPKTEESENLI